MQVESKYNIHQRIFWMESNKVRSAIVKAIQFPMVSWRDKQTHQGMTRYYVSDRVKSRVINWNGGGLREDEVFPSKKELLKSL